MVLATFYKDKDKDKDKQPVLDLEHFSMKTKRIFENFATFAYEDWDKETYGRLCKFFDENQSCSPCQGECIHGLMTIFG